MGKTGSSQDLYDILGVAKDASAQDIKKAFRVLARECHPDVAGTDPKMAEKFKQAREAYEVLADPVQRARYDRRGERRTNPFFGSSWNRGNVNVGAPPPAAASSGGRAGNDLDLEDIFNDFGVGDFGFTGQTRGQPAAAPGGGRPKAAPPPETGRFTGGGAANGTGRSGPRRGGQPGRDISVAVDVPADVAARGGTVTVAYTRLRRADDGHTLYRYDELHDLKVPPGMRHGDTLRVTGMGDAGLDGGRYGELVADLKVVGGRARSVDQRGGAWDPEEEGARSEAAPGSGAGGAAGGVGGAAGGGAAPEDGARRDPGRMKMPSREDAGDGILRVNVGIVEALLGGRVPVETPGGLVRVTIPPGTSSGTRMRLRGRGPVGGDGVATDLVAEVRIVVPKTLDAESRRLIERFGELNPTGE